MSDIDFEKAYALFARIRQGDVDAALKNDLASMLLPMAETMALSKAAHYKGGPLATRMDYDACLSSALEGVQQVVEELPYHRAKSTKSFISAVSTIINRRMHDLERSAYSHGRRQKSASHVEQWTERTAAPGRSPFHELHKSLSRDELDEVDALLLDLLSPQQYEVISALIQNKMRGQELSIKEVAQSLDMKLGTFKSAMDRARKILDEQMGYKYEEPTGREYIKQVIGLLPQPRRAAVMR